MNCRTPRTLSIVFAAVSLAAASGLLAAASHAAEASDVPSDDGSQIGLTWPVSEDSGGAEYVIYRAASALGPFEEVERFTTAPSF